MRLPGSDCAIRGSTPASARIVSRRHPVFRFLRESVQKLVFFACIFARVRVNLLSVEAERREPSRFAAMLVERRLRKGNEVSLALSHRRSPQHGKTKRTISAGDMAG